jgi:hypothetical protein
MQKLNQSNQRQNDRDILWVKESKKRKLQKSFTNLEKQISILVCRHRQVIIQTGCASS